MGARRAPVAAAAPGRDRPDLGALPGGSFLSEAYGAERDWFDVDHFRHGGRRAVIREVARPVLVLGSTQTMAVVDRTRAAARGVAVVRRRSGGGAVLLTPGAQVWADIWIPSTDPLWAPEPRAAAGVAGEWWARALGGSTAALEVQRDPSEPVTRHLVCFAGVGPGEVLARGKKVVGLAQWRARQGFLVHGCVYRRWDPEPLVDLLALARSERAALAEALADAATGLEDLGLAGWDADALVEALPPGEPWTVARA